MPRPSETRHRGKGRNAMDNRDLFTNLAIVAAIDGDVALQERLLLDEYAKKLKIGFLEAQQIIDEVKKGKRQSFSKPRNPKVRENMYRAMIRIVRSDARITRKEQKLLKRIGNLLDIDEELMRSALDQAPGSFPSGDEVIEL